MILRKIFSKEARNTIRMSTETGNCQQLTDYSVPALVSICNVGAAEQVLNVNVGGLLEMLASIDATHSVLRSNCCVRMAFRTKRPWPTCFVPLMI